MQGQGACPVGWAEATLTHYDSWPYPESQEWQKYDGGKYLGVFAYKYTSSTCDKADEVKLTSWQATATGTKGTIPGEASKMPTCHWTASFVARSRFAAVFAMNTTPYLGSIPSDGGTIRIAAMEHAKAGVNAGMLVNVWDTCADSDCNQNPNPPEGCCTHNANLSPKVLIDLEKNTLKAFIPTVTGLVASDVTYSNQVVTYNGPFFIDTIAGAPASICFRFT
jgi:hypothetical protein